MRNNNRRKTRSWGLIVFMFIIFFPVGIYMMVKKVTTEKHNYIKNGKALKAFGWSFFVMGTIFVMSVLDGSSTYEGSGEVVSFSDAFPIIAFFYIFSGVCILKGRKYVKRGLRFERYEAIVNSGKIYSLEGIASAFPTDYKTACKDLQEMIAAGFFPFSYIDLDKKMLITPETPSARKDSGKQDASEPGLGKAKVVKCPNCGATNAVYSEAVAKCKYCDSLLEANAAK
ncbi:hypothetical protein CDQ84_16460 [Clostridium thermosuccinogenes]|jgi:hypothetical protein|uniref:Uncharacterized protein n=1 Tax=Clostridium thermosuccinogenes TaxID=84032 RepID=A0A2K2F8H1_9CLOT|nr:hypothetical protein [Pseudoclostridium thermosuccinogenes]PNT95064.1 hypothetical protein CDQ85_16225 [Pseudoclostridium thermosuccinogenes]PNT95785.1 hypothetical protein CDQ84_16460 [Pseudoclostridium thermosuccinogenes]